MKIRDTFVTNSSSSSFIVIGKKVHLQDIDLSKGRYIALGNSLCEGEDVFDIDKDILELLPFIDYDFTFFFVESLIHEGKCNVKIDGGIYDIYCCNADYHGTENANDLMKNYKFSKDKLVKLLRKGKIDIDTFLRMSGYEK